MTATKPFARSRSRQRATASSRPKNRSASSWPNGARPGYGLRDGSGGAATPSATTAATSSTPSRPRSSCGPSSRSSTPAGNATRSTAAVDPESTISPVRPRSRTRAARLTVGPSTSPSTAMTSPVARPARTRTPPALERLRCIAIAACTALPAFGNAETVASPSTVAPTRRPPCASTARSITSCISASNAGTRCGARSHSCVEPTTSVSNMVATPVGVSSPQPARSRSTSSPGVAGRRAGSIASPSRNACFQTAGYVGRDAVPPWRATSRRFTGQQREDRRRQAEDVAGAGRDATAGDLRRAKTGSSTASSRRDRHRRRSEVDEHDATRAVEDEVGRLHVTVHNAVLMQHRQRFGGLCGPPQHARRGKAGLTFVGEQLREVDAVDPVEHEHMPSLVEQVVTRVGDCRMGRKREQCARFEQQVFSLAIDRAASDLQRDETFVTRVDGLHDRRFAAATDRLDRLVATGDTSLSHGRLECVGSLGCLECRRALRPLRRAPHSRGATDVAPGLRC